MHVVFLCAGARSRFPIDPHKGNEVECKRDDSKNSDLFHAMGWKEREYFNHEVQVSMTVGCKLGHSQGSIGGVQ